MTHWCAGVRSAPHCSQKTGAGSGSPHFEQRRGIVATGGQTCASSSGGQTCGDVMSMPQRSQ